MHTRDAGGIALFLALSGLALGQSQTLVDTQDDAEPGGAGQGIIATGPEVGVGRDAVMVFSNRRMALYDRTPTVLDLRRYSDANFPWEVGDNPTPLTDLNALWDAKSNHDPIANRLWMAYAEGEAPRLSQFLYPACGEIARLHLAVNKDPAVFPSPGGPLNSLDISHWWYYTGESMMGANPRPYFELVYFPFPSGFAAYKTEAKHAPPDGSIRMPNMGFDEQAIIVAPSEQNEDCESVNTLSGDVLYSQHIFIIPRTHNAGVSSILNGNKPADADITHIRLDTDQVIFPVGRLKDESEFFCVAQEPFPNLPAPAAPDQVENATFFVNVIDRAAEIQKDIRVRGLFDADPGPGVDWTLQQQTSSLPAPINLVDMPLPPALHFTNPTKSLLNPLPLLPRTPDMSTPYAWRPNAVGAIFHSAVLARDTNGDHRIFATHAVQPAQEGQDGTISTIDQWVVQWYVIDPKLSDFGTGTIGQWQPAIVASGRLPGEGDRYHPVIVVNRQGQAFIEYTYSDDSTWPQIRRVRLNSSYTATVANTDLPVLSGPMLPYAPGDPSTPGEELNYDNFWADYADAQADPFNGCAYWSTHTLVHNDTVANPTDKRDIWLFHQAYSNSVGPNCLQTNSMLDLNDDTEVDAYDLAAFGPMFERGARRVDIDGNGIVEALDMVLFYDAYDAYTSR